MTIFKYSNFHILIYINYINIKEFLEGKYPLWHPLRVTINMSIQILYNIYRNIKIFISLYNNNIYLFE